MCLSRNGCVISETRVKKIRLNMFRLTQRVILKEKKGQTLADMYIIYQPRLMWKI